MIKVHLKGWNSSNIWEKHLRIKILFRKKLTADCSQGILVINRCRIFCLPVCYPKTWRLLYRTIILPLLLYGCETWSLTMREARRLKMFENMVLRRIFGPKRDEVIGKQKRLHNLQLNYYLYSLPNIVQVINSRKVRWARYVARKGERRGVYRVLMGKPEGKRPLGRPRHTWDDNIKMDLQEVGWKCMNGINLAQDRDMERALLNAAINLRVPLNRGEFLDYLRNC